MKRVEQHKSLSTSLISDASPARTDLSNNGMLDAVMRRDRAYDSLFVYGVASTGIYCRPSCPSRRPSRSKITIFNGPAEAELAGLRACMRCRPRDEYPRDVTLSRKASVFIGNNLDRKLTLKELSTAVGVSEFHLQRTFKRVVGVTPKRFAGTLKLERIRGALKRGDSVRRSLYDAGYDSLGSFSSKRDETLGMRVSEYKKGGEGMDILYSITSCMLGRLLVGATRYGVCSLAIGVSDARLISILKSEYPSAVIQQDRGSISGWLGMIVEYVEGERPVSLSRMPLDIQATAFQRRVWEELRAVPYGTTVTYGELARRISQPQASRAVGKACATNPVALLIPCHRVVRKDGSIGGYRWGVEKKRLLLEKERELSREKSN
ncbi:MAG: methylated-DNA--[protein]-cysteine S-methyltransferase [Thaumarchaeota archaeon]|nr:methylated-DNA--[protein]-cysteine S-methyltransferase [Nitrososphaerota archaeon]